METIKRKINIPADHHLKFDIQLPDSIPSGSAEVVLVFQPSTKSKLKDKKRTAGLYSDKDFFMAEDFDSPLSDSFWSGESNS
jgi:hypothetical protein